MMLWSAHHDDHRDIIEIIVVCALIFFPLGYLRGTLCDAFATPYVCSLLNLVC